MTDKFNEQVENMTDKFNEQVENMTDKFNEQVENIIKADVPNRHTFFQLNFFILGKEPTHQAKLKRCVEELRTRKESLDALALEVDDLEDRNKLLLIPQDSASSNSFECEIKTRMAKRKVVANKKAIDNLRSRGKNVEEEMVFFIEAFNRLNEIEPMKQWDDVEVQTQYWNAKIAEEVNHRILMHLPIDVEIIKTALSLPVGAPIRKNVVALLQRQSDKLLSLDNNSQVAHK